MAAGHHGGPGSDSGSSHSDSVESSSSGCKRATQQAQQLRGALKAQQTDADKYVTYHGLLGSTSPVLTATGLDVNRQWQTLTLLQN